MTQERVKIVIEVSGGVVQAVYAGAQGRLLIWPVVIDHDEARVGEVPTQSLIEAPTPQDTAAYDGGYPDGWATWA